jgi:hypothetical protein
VIDKPSTHHRARSPLTPRCQTRRTSGHRSVIKTTLSAIRSAIDGAEAVAVLALEAVRKEP